MGLRIRGAFVDRRDTAIFEFMPASIELAAMVTSRLAELTRATAESPQGVNAIEDPDDSWLAPPTSRGR